MNTATVRSTLDANNACLKDQIDDRGYNHYKLDPSYCYHSNASFLTVEVRIPDTNSTVPSWALLVNTQGNVPVFDDDNFTISNGTVAVSSGEHPIRPHFSFRQHMNVVVHLVLSAKLLLQPNVVSSFWYIREESITKIGTYITAKCSNAEFLPSFSVADSIDGKSYALLNVMLAVSDDSAPDIYASVYSTGGPLVFLLKAWCSGTLP